MAKYLKWNCSSLSASFPAAESHPYEKCDIFAKSCCKSVITGAKTAFKDYAKIKQTLN